MKNVKRNSKGFTILELLIATTVFSVVLLLASGAIVQLSRHFYKGLIKSQTQQVARNISEEIITNIQYSASQPHLIGVNGEVTAWCIANHRYAFVEGKQLGPGLDQSAGVLVRSNNCTGSVPNPLVPGAGDVELIGDNMRLAYLDIQPGLSGDVWEVRVKVVHGDDDIVQNPNNENASCTAEMAGSQFCATAEYTATVVRRL